jgi:hypothetical protein
MFVYDADDKMERCIGEFEASSLFMQRDWEEKYKVLLSFHCGGCC